MFNKDEHVTLILGTKRMEILIKTTKFSIVDADQLWSKARGLLACY